MPVSSSINLKFRFLDNFTFWWKQLGLALGKIDVKWVYFIDITLGSVPFLLREHLSYSQLAIFALSGYPYSLKLLWSPIVDSVFFPAVGRRKSWIIPMQIIIGTLMLLIASHVDVLLDTVSILSFLLKI